jgi:hypothetical protein
LDSSGLGENWRRASIHHKNEPAIYTKRGEFLDCARKSWFTSKDSAHGVKLLSFNLIL